MLKYRLANKAVSLLYMMPLRCYLFNLFVLVFIIGLLLSHTASAKAFKNIPLTSNTLGENIRWQKSQYIKATLAFNNENYYLAMRLLKPLAQQGDKQAQLLLATQYDLGLGAEKDAYLAFRWYKKAAMSGMSVAQHNLGVAYAQGSGVKMNLIKAVIWWERAALNGHTDAQYNLGIIFAVGRGVIERNLTKALKWWRMAAINGDVMAMFNLGALYANGIGMSNRTCEASRWWKKSLEHGFAEAKLALAIIQKDKSYEACR